MTVKQSFAALSLAFLLGQPAPAQEVKGADVTTAFWQRESPAPVEYRYAATSTRRRVRRRTARRYYTTAPNGQRYVSGPVYRTRSKKKSAAIIVGSAGTGAAIGALAGGGKGAAIGALAGGAAGTVYDQSTRKKVH